MGKRNTIIFTSILTIVASILTFYFTGCLLTGVFNKGQGLVRMLIMLTPGLSGLLMPVELIVIIFFVMRLYKRPNAIKRFLKTYSITLICLSAVGLISAILAGALLYKSFIEPSPFPGFLIIITIWHFLIITLGVLILAVFRKKVCIVNEDNEGRGVLHIFWTIGLSIIVFYAFNRFGALLISPFYVQLRTLDLTWPFYVTLLALIALLIQGSLYYFDVYKTSKRKTVGLVVTISLTLVFTASFILTGVLGSKGPLFLSAVSPAVPLERMLTKPIEFVLHSIAAFVSIAALLTMSIICKYKDLKGIPSNNNVSGSIVNKIDASKVDIKEKMVTPSNNASTESIKEKVEIKEDKKEEPKIVEIKVKENQTVEIPGIKEEYVIKKVNVKKEDIKKENKPGVKKVIIKQVPTKKKVSNTKKKEEPNKKIETKKETSSKKSVSKNTTTKKTIKKSTSKKK